MKNKIAILCMFVILFCSVGSMAQTIRIPIPDKTVDYGGAGSSVQQRITSSTSLGLLIDCEDKFKGVIIRRAISWADNIGNMCIAVYPWKDTYKNTLKTTPVADKIFENFYDNSDLNVYFEPQPAGKYLIHIYGGTQLAGVRASTETKNPATAFLNGTEKDVYVRCSAVYEPVLIEKTTGDNVDVTRNAYEKIPVADFDAQLGITISEIPENEQKAAGAQKMIKGRIGGVAKYSNVDFGNTSPKGIKMGIYCGNFSDLHQVHIVADDPYNQPVAVFQYEFDRNDCEWKVYPATVTKTITGVHDIYLITRGNFDAVQISWFEFVEENPGLSTVEQRLADFNNDDIPGYTDTYADTWVATDMLGRKLPGHETVGDFNPDKQVGIFYWTWHVNVGNRTTMNVINVHEMIKKYPEIKNDYNAPQWNGQTSGFTWGESVYGLYTTYDEWVIRKQMELLECAGVDTLIYDTTNGGTYNTGAMKVAKVMHQMHTEGVDTPKFTFLFPFANNEYNVLNIQNVYELMFQTGLYSDCWYYWKGKPLLMGYPDLLKQSTGYEDIDKLYAEMYDYFTFRPGQSKYSGGSRVQNDWPWLEVYPQNPYGASEKYGCECVAVGIAQNANDQGGTAMNGEGIYGRSYTYKNKHTLLSEESKYYGYNFQEQWDRAFELDPEFVFVTGWNEYRMGRNKEWGGVANAFPDQFNDEYSRDIEPVKGDLQDVYYYQLVSNIRKFKGVRPTPVASAEKSIKFSGAFSQWDSVSPEYTGISGGTDERDFPGYMSLNYKNDTGRNDIVLSKVARDKSNLYFYVKTNESLTPHTDKSWMRLFINTDRIYKTGWEGYDFAVNIESPSTRTSACLSYSADGWNWKTVGEIYYKYSKNQMMLRIPKSMLGLTDEKIDIEFKWIDNMQKQGDIMDVYNNGDSAPIGRFAYRYTETAEEDKAPAEEPVTIAELKKNQYKYSVIMAIDNPVAFAGGQQQTLDVAPQLINGKTMVPIRFFAESFGAEVKWNDIDRTATVTLNGNTVEITTGKQTVLVNGVTEKLECPAVLKKGRVLVPLRKVTEGLGKKVLWIDGGLVIAGENPETVCANKWVRELIAETYGIAVSVV